MFENPGQPAEVKKITKYKLAAKDRLTGVGRKKRRKKMYIKERMNDRGVTEDEKKEEEKEEVIILRGEDVQKKRKRTKNKKSKEAIYIYVSTVVIGKGEKGSSSLEVMGGGQGTTRQNGVLGLPASCACTFSKRGRWVVGWSEEEKSQRGWWEGADCR